MKRTRCCKKIPVAFIGLLVTFCCFMVMIVSVLKLPDLSASVKQTSKKIEAVTNVEKMGKFGEMMIEMLPEDLPFTIFVPSEKALERDLRIRVNDSLVEDKKNDTYAVVSRVLGYSAVPRVISSSTLRGGEEVSYDSLSGFTLYISKNVDGSLVVNGVRSVRVDVRRGELVVHIVDGVVMDAGFRQSVQADYDEED